MNGGDKQRRLQWDEARLWLAKASEDDAAARMLLSGGLAGLAAFHVQQAAEKALKALWLRQRRTYIAYTTSTPSRTSPELIGLMSYRHPSH